MTIDISPRDQRLFFSLLKKHVPNMTIWAYGSRTKGTAKQSSDLDIVIFTDQILPVAALREALTESDLSFRVDVFRWNDVPEPFKKIIEKEHVVLTPLIKNK